MQQPRDSQEMSVASSRRVMLVLMSLNTLYEYMYCTMLSSALGMLPVFGGAMFMSARVAMTMTHSVFGDGRKYLTRRMRIAFTVITAVMLLCTLTLIALYPVLLSAAPVWIVFAVVLSVSVRAISGRRLTVAGCAAPSARAPTGPLWRFHTSRLLALWRGFCLYPWKPPAPG